MYHELCLWSSGHAAGKPAARPFLLILPFGMNLAEQVNIPITKEGIPVLVLTRRLDQTIMLGDPLSPEKAMEVTVVEVRGDQVRIGIIAPRDTPVHRKEIWLQRQGEQEDAQ